ncbi:MAG TPA: (Fe-S)-binding protein, partial [Candidatus Latescibacteria bacterium]|nr:(Fe-S)-binding protein [Candidatus Latescibacterota bacterium]
MNPETKPAPRWDFHAATRQSLRNESLAKALFRATAKFDDGRRALMAALPESDLLREKARQIKDDVLQHLDRYLAQFADSVEKA